MYCIYPIHVQATLLFTYCSYMYLIIGDLDLLPGLLKLDGEPLLGLLQGAVLLLEDLVFSLWEGGDQQKPCSVSSVHHLFRATGKPSHLLLLQLPSKSGLLPFLPFQLLVRLLQQLPLLLCLLPLLQYMIQINPH